MTFLQNLYLERIDSLADAIYMLAKNVDCAETECIKGLAGIINETADMFLKEEEK